MNLLETTKKCTLSARGKINKIEQKEEFRGYWEKVFERNWFQGRKGFRREGQAARQGQGWNNTGTDRARNRAGICSERVSKSYKKFFCKQRSVMWFLLHWNKSTEGHELDLHLIEWHWQLLIHVYIFQKSGFNLYILLQGFSSHNLHSLISLLRSSRNIHYLPSDEQIQTNA